MSFRLEQNVRYRMPVVFGPAPGPRQKADGTPWTIEETGTVRVEWMTVFYQTERASIERHLPPGFTLRGEPRVAVSMAYFHNLYWLAGRGYGIAIVDFPVTFQGKTERIDGGFCAAMWEGQPDAIMTGREELGFPKLFADIPLFERSGNGASASASWLGHRFLDFSLNDLKEVAQAPAVIPGFDGPPLYFKYMPRTGPPGSGGDVYVTTPLPVPGGAGDASPIKLGGFKFRKWTAQGSVKWNRATFEQLPTAFHVINALADIPMTGMIGAEMVEFTGPGIGISAMAVRSAAPA